MKPIDRILERLPNAKPSGDGSWMALCPAHDDHKPSLSIKVKDGKVLLNCFTGCATENIVKALGLTLADLFNDAPANSKSGRGGVSVAKLAEVKKLSLKTLEKFDLTNSGGGKVKIPYYSPNGKLAPRSKIRHGLSGKESFWTGKQGTPILPYGLQFLGAARKVGYIVLVEGESDTWTCWHHRIPALGLPGASTTKLLKRSYFDGIDKIYAWQEIDEAGKSFVKAVLGRFASWRTWAGSIHVLSLDGVKDPSELHLQAPDSFKTTMTALMEAAAPVDMTLSSDESDTTAQRDPNDSRPSIRLDGAELHTVVEQSVAALNSSNEPPHVFVRTGRLCRITRIDDLSTVQELDRHSLRVLLAESALFYKISNGREVALFPDRGVVDAILALSSWPFPALEGITGAPVMRPDGSVLDTPGYDEATKLYYAPEADLEVPPVPETPTKQDVNIARAALLDVVADFPFADPASRANALALLFSVLLRPIIAGSVPMLLIDSPVQGTGKTLLFSVLSIIATGGASLHTIATGTRPRDTDIELRKELLPVLLSGAPLCCFDNLPSRTALNSPSLAAVLTSDTYEARVLGESRLARVRVRAVFAATGNNISLAGDMPRRCYTARLDADCERPETREGFKHSDLLSYVRKNRARLLHAALVLARAWFAAGKPSPGNLPIFGGFTEWTDIIGGILTNAEIYDFLRNLDMTRAAQDDDSAQWTAFFALWWDILGSRPISTRDLAAKIAMDTTWRDNLPDIFARALEHGLESPAFKKSLGRQLKALCGRVFSDCKLTASHDSHQKRQVWRLNVVDLRVVRVVAGSDVHRPHMEKVENDDDVRTSRCTGDIHDYPQLPALPANDPEGAEERAAIQAYELEQERAAGV